MTPNEGSRGMLSLCVTMVMASLATGDERPLLHFTPQKNWINDPNGLIWVDGEYHLFCQYNPEGDQWGHMSWGHAVSKDLLTWEHLPVAIPETDDVMAFSGTAVLDTENTSGFGAPGQPAMVAVYTGHDGRAKRQHQNLAYSTDRGRTWTIYAGNPVLDLGVEEFRDPKVFWHAPTKRWIMVVSLAPRRTALFFGSPDLKHWTKLSEFGPAGQPGVPNWECPDLFELPLESGETRWVLVVSVGGNGPAGGPAVEYFVGRFDGGRFISESDPKVPLWIDYGRDFYAFQSFQNEPSGKRIGLAWMASPTYAGATPTSPWRCSMTVPREFTLTRAREGIRLVQKPLDGIAEFLKARGGVATSLSRQEIGAGVAQTGIAGSAALIEAEFKPGSAERFGIRVREGGTEFTAIGYDAKRHELFIDRSHSGKTDFHPQFRDVQSAPVDPAPDGTLKLTIVVDSGSIEAFANGGAAAITSLVFPAPDSRGVSLLAERGTATLERLSAVSLSPP